MLKINTLVWKLASFSYIFAASKVIIKPMFNPSPKERSRIKVAPLRENKPKTISKLF
jgi:hypothetical protein